MSGSVNSFASLSAPHRFGEPALFIATAATNAGSRLPMIHESLRPDKMISVSISHMLHKSVQPIVTRGPNPRRASIHDGAFQRDHRGESRARKIMGPSGYRHLPD
jgi:hypothetical protein